MDFQEFVAWERAQEKQPRLEENMAFSAESLKQLRGHILEELGEPTEGDSPTVVVSGSLARLEASRESDIDYMIIYPEGAEPNGEGIRERVNAAISRYEFEDDAGDSTTFPPPNPKGVFRGDVDGGSLVSDIGKKGEEYENISRRLLLVLESEWLWNEDLFRGLQQAIIDEYAMYVEDDPRKHFVVLINDLIRYFRSLCVNYHAQTKEDDEYGKWPIRNIKLRHSRVLMYMSLLLVVGELSKPEYAQLPGPEKVQELRDYIELPPIERIARLYQQNGDANLYLFLGLYNVFLDGISDPGTRGELWDLEYEERYDSRVFARLKANSDAFQRELLRFTLDRRGAWSDRFYEYVIL